MQDNLIFYQKSLNDELKNNGLIIIEAYYGLADHIIEIDAGQYYKLPSTIEEYLNMQVIPIKKRLQILVKDSQLVLHKSLFKKSSRSMFNPCVNKQAKTLLYIKYKY